MISLTPEKVALIVAQMSLTRWDPTDGFIIERVEIESDSEMSFHGITAEREPRVQNFDWDEGRHMWVPTS